MYIFKRVGTVFDFLTYVIFSKEGQYGRPHFCSRQTPLTTPLERVIDGDGNRFSMHLGSFQSVVYEGQALCYVNNFNMLFGDDTKIEVFEINRDSKNEAILSGADYNNQQVYEEF